MNKMRWGVVLLLSLVLSVMPLPGKLILIEPPWLLLLLLYMMMFESGAHQRMGANAIHWVWLMIGVMGYLLDAIQVSILGEHVLALSISLWIAALKINRFHGYSLNQQMAFVGMLCWCYEGTLCFIDLSLGDKVSWYVIIAGAIKGLIAIMCWPWFRAFMTDYLQPAVHGERDLHYF